MCVCVCISLSYTCNIQPLLQYTRNTQVLIHIHVHKFSLSLTHTHTQTHTHTHTQHTHPPSASIVKYLLEKSRIISQAAGERNYHVFYYLLAGADSQLRRSLNLLQINQYHYLTQVIPVDAPLTQFFVLLMHDCVCECQCVSE